MPGFGDSLIKRLQEGLFLDHLFLLPFILLIWVRLLTLNECYHTHNKVGLLHTLMGGQGFRACMADRLISCS